MKTTCLSRVCAGVSFFVCFLAPLFSQAAEVAKSPHGPNDEIGVLNTLTAAHNLTVLLGADNMGVEKFPMSPESVHTYVFAERGVCLLELVWLEDLAKDRVYEFAFIAAPIKLRGATGSPTRPLALPLRSKQ